MDYVIVRASGSDADYVITADYDDALRRYRRWLAAYLAETGDQFAREHLDHLSAAVNRLDGQAIHYRSPRYGSSARTERVFALCALAWPRIWQLPPPTGIGRDWGRTVRRLTGPAGVYELRTNGTGWRIFWLDARSEAAFATTGTYPAAAEAAADLAFIDAARRSRTSPPTTAATRPGRERRR
jgi:hypothetical protein